jgi:ADP-heptose:LPS heptosyltransferase
MSRSTLLAVRLDSVGDMILTGPAIRAMATGHEVVVLAGPNGEAAARLLPGVEDVIVWNCPWICAQPPPVERADLESVREAIARWEFESAVIFTSYHQSALPTALLLRLAGIAGITAFSEDYPGSLVDMRVLPPGDVPETERALPLADRAGYRLPASDSGRLRVEIGQVDVASMVPDRPYVVLHPGVSVPARAWPLSRWVEMAELLVAQGRRIVLTGSIDEAAMCRRIAGPGGWNVAGKTDLRQLAAVLAGAEAVMVANTGPAHLAAAVGTPVVSFFAPVVPAGRWAPYGVPTVLLGRQEAACRGTRSRECPISGHPCLSGVTAADAAAALNRLAPTTFLEIGVQ